MTNFTLISCGLFHVIHTSSKSRTGFDEVLYSRSLFSNGSHDHSSYRNNATPYVNALADLEDIGWEHSVNTDAACVPVRESDPTQHFPAMCPRTAL